MPVFQNRSSFIENWYIDNLQYDIVLVNFFALKLQNFNNILLSENINYKLQFDKLLSSMFNISQKFYTNYLRTIFDLENNTYVQDYNKKYGLLVNNGFKIYPRYFYFSDNDMYRYYNFNFGIYNWQEINNGGLFPDKQWWQVQYVTPAGWWDFGAHIKNAVIWIVNTIPGIKQVNELASGVGNVFEAVYSFFSEIFEVWKFNPALYSIIKNIFLLIIFMKFVRLI
ncbi:Spiroplasmavirus-related protein [Spiroplasma kunkelii CR2-3x]|uniref:Spiroplasmavirus-related protein n=1 Tax=Spiroplasma kunkelii CR2-3x TaxID=273035 RepID=A0A0K2JJ12_SPIKU|nr:Spiroplasmavirus-related protein [Spiroplasma kunkelii CR2-3x]